VKKLIAENEIGSILSVHSEVGEFLPGWHKYEDYRQMYASKKDLGGGVVLSQIHEIDYLYDLFGLPSRVFATGGHLSHLEIDVEDVVDVIMEMKFQGKKIPVSLHLDYIQQPPSRSCKFIGNHGKILLDFANLSVIVEKPDADKKIYDFSGFERNELFIQELDHFFKCVAARRQPMISLADGINSLKIALSIKRSIDLKEQVICKNIQEGFA
jgi:predicted dehydrogenase